MFPFTLDIYCTSVRPGRGIPHMWLSLRFLLSFYLLKGFFSSFSLLLLRVKGRGCQTLLKPYETNCGLWIWAIQIKFDWLMCDKPTSCNRSQSPNHQKSVFTRQTIWIVVWSGSGLPLLCLCLESEQDQTNKSEPNKVDVSDALFLRHHTLCCSFSQGFAQCAVFF